MAIKTDAPYIEIRLRGEEEDFPLLLDVTSFLYDFNLLYEFARLSTDPRYARYTFSRQSSWGRNARPLDDDDRLRIVRLRHESPMDLVAIATLSIGAAGAIWAVAQTAEKVWNMPLNRRILKLQQEKLQKELSDGNDKNVELPDEEGFKVQLKSRELEYHFDRTADRLRRGSIRIKEIEVNVVPHPPRKED